MPVFNIRVDGARTSIRLTRAERRALNTLAELDGKTVNEWCAAALARASGDEDLNRTQAIRSAVVDALFRRAGLESGDGGPELQLVRKDPPG